MPFRLKFSVALGANEGLGHNHKIANHKNYGYGNGDKVPRRVEGFAKPIYLAGGEKKG